MRPAAADGLDHPFRTTDETRQREVVFGVQFVDEMVRHPGTIFCARLGRSYIETTIDLEGVATDELAPERLGEFDRERGLTRAGGTDDGEERRPTLA